MNKFNYSLKSASTASSNEVGVCPNTGEDWF